jgi:hypothetical protein
VDDTSKDSFSDEQVLEYLAKRGSSAESVGGFWLRQIAKSVIWSEFCDVKGAESVGFSHGEFGFVVEALDHPAGELLLGAEIIEDELAVAAQGLGNLFHRLDARAHGLLAPVVEELRGPGRRVVVPELLEVFLEQVLPL